MGENDIEVRNVTHLVRFHVRVCGVEYEVDLGSDGSWRIPIGLGLIDQKRLESMEKLCLGAVKDTPPTDTESPEGTEPRTPRSSRSTKG